MLTSGSSLSENLHIWYQKNKRDLPWRHITDAYQIWISEVILQQTRVAQGLPYFFTFIDLFPTVKDLANATEQEVLRCWQGLGYYSRARNMHFTALTIVKDYKGIFPNSYQQLISLKGIGAYTAAAVASFSSNENVAVLDGNVMRVLSRVFAIELNIALEKTKKELQKIATEMLPIGKAAIHNQAIMELGAVICTPKNPKCEICPINQFCLAIQLSKVDILPIKEKKINVKTRYFNYLVLRNAEGNYLMKKRTSKDIWSGLWDFYLIESNSALDAIHELQIEPIIKENLTFLHASEWVKHQLTHQTIYAKFWSFEISIQNHDLYLDNNLKLFNIEELQQIPKPTLISNFFERNKH